MRERAYLHIQRKLASGELRAGSSVSELALATELGISRTPVREALGQLAAEGLLEHSPNRGTVVVQVTRQDIIDLYELREALEVYAVGKAARQPVRIQDVDRLQNLADEILVLKQELEQSGQETLDLKQMDRFITCDLGFHTLLMHMASNVRMLRAVNETRVLIRIFAIHRHGHSADELTEIHRYHCEILKSVAERDPERAMKSLAGHIQKSREERLDEYDQWEREMSLQRSVHVFFDVHQGRGPR